MSIFWPNGIDLNDTESPLDILKNAKKEWEAESNGMLTLLLQETESESGNKMIIVHAKHVPGNRTTTLFSVVHRPKDAYPVNIQPEKVDMPEFLKKTYYKPGIADMGIRGIQGRTVTNEWVSETPSEFRSSLKKVFNLGYIKQEVLSLLSYSPVTEDQDSNKEPNNLAPEN